MPLVADFVKKLRIRMHRHLFDARYDVRRAVETASILMPEQLGLAGENASHAVQYEPTPTKLFGYVFRNLAQHFNFSEFVFADIGSGKGRIVLLAAEMPFLRVEGVELSGILHQIAKRNLQQMAAVARSHAPVVLHNQDASTYRLPEEPLLLYLFNPFDAAVMEQIHDNLRRSLEENPRECVVVYVNSKHRDIFDRDATFAELPRTFSQALVETLLSPWPIAVYRAQCPRQCEPR